jgi:hypothetical protein
MLAWRKRGGWHDLIIVLSFLSVVWFWYRYIPAWITFPFEAFILDLLAGNFQGRHFIWSLEKVLSRWQA